MQNDCHALIPGQDGDMLEASTIWMAVATILLVSEFIGADFDGLLPGAVLALALALLTSWLTLPLLVHGLLFTALAVVGTLALSREPVIADENALGDSARVRRPFSDDGIGWVQWRGRRWQAQCLEPGQSPGPGEQVQVVGREGNCLLVMPAQDPALAAISRRTSD
jgi:membrane protein implicated in regulation of membrane protease activity